MRHKTPNALEMAVKAAAKDSLLETGRAVSGFYFYRLLCQIFSDPGLGFVLKGRQVAGAFPKPFLVQPEKTERDPHETGIARRIQKEVRYR